VVNSKKTEEVNYAAEFCKKKCWVFVKKKVGMLPCNNWKTRVEFMWDKCIQFYCKQEQLKQYIQVGFNKAMINGS
jgi:hypothetical protein